MKNASNQKNLSKLNLESNFPATGCNTKKFYEKKGNTTKIDTRRKRKSEERPRKTNKRTAVGQPTKVTQSYSGSAWQTATNTNAILPPTT